MTEYIDKAELLDALARLKERWGNTFTAEGVGEAIEKVEQANTEDVVEVVRCKDCKYWKQVTEERQACYYSGLEMDYDEFCSRGERK